MQKDVAGLDKLLQLSWCFSRYRDAVVMTKIDHCIAMRVAGDERLQLLHRLRASEVIKLDSVLLRIEINDAVSAHTRRKYEIVTAGTANQNRNVLADVGAGVLSVGNADVVRLAQGLARREIDLILAECEAEIERPTVTVLHDGNTADIVCAARRHALTIAIARRDFGGCNYHRRDRA